VPEEVSFSKLPIKFSSPLEPVHPIKLPSNIKQKIAIYKPFDICIKSPLNITDMLYIKKFGK